MTNCTVLSEQAGTFFKHSWIRFLRFDGKKPARKSDGSKNQ
jgi:hypothetical protein